MNGNNARSLVVLLGALAYPLYAGPVARSSLSSLTQRADLIVVGSANIAIQSTGIAGGSILVVRTLKGTTPVGDLVRVSYTPAQPWTAEAGASTKSYGMFFLQQKGGEWTILPASAGDVSWSSVYFALPETLPPGLLQSAGLTAAASSIDKVYLELALAFETGAGPVGPPIDLVVLFRESESPVLKASLGRMAVSQNAANKGVALRALLTVGDESALQQLKLNRPSFAAQSNWSSVLQELQIYYVNPSPTSIQSLAEMSVDTSQGADLQKAAAGALARMHTKEALPYLAKLLDSQDIALQSMAIGGMASFANNVPIGSHEPAAGAWQYRTDDTIAHSAFDERLIAEQPQYYVSFWRAWWQTNQSKLAP